jgi:uncharacterized phage protein (TIGR01671 family)
MIREILFKGKRTDNGEWEFGYAIKLPTLEWEIASLCQNPIDCDQMWERVVITHKVDPDTICQYTGLKDKFGNRIFEGDIVSTIDDGVENPNYVVIFDSEELDFKATNGKENYYTNYVYISCCEEIKIIGNIFDNPELLGELEDIKEQFIQEEIF